jgi:hypothetical protein
VTSCLSSLAFLDMNTTWTSLSIHKTPPTGQLVDEEHSGWMWENGEQHDWLGNRTTPFEEAVASSFVIISASVPPPVRKRRFKLETKKGGEGWKGEQTYCTQAGYYGSRTTTSTVPKRTTLRRNSAWAWCASI